MMIEFPGVVQMTTGGLGEIWMMTGSQDGWMMIGFPAEGAKTQDLVSGDHLSSQVDGEKKKKPEKRVGVHLESQDHQKNVNGIEKKRERKMVKIVTRTTRTQRERGTERETGGTERSASDAPGMKVTGEEAQLRKLQAGEIQVAVTIGIEMTAVVTEMIAVISEKDEMRETAEDRLSDQSVKKEVLGDVLMTGKMTGWKSGMPLVVFLPQLFQEIEKEIERKTKKVKKRRPRGELRKIGNLFVVLKMRLMRMDGLQYDVKSQDNGFKLMSYIGLITFKDDYTCASTSLNWIL